MNTRPSNGPHMTEAQERHLEGIKENLLVALDRKYRRGQAEHGGHLRQKGGMVPQLADEIVDAVVYLDTLKDQLSDVLALLDKGLEHQDWRLIGKARAWLVRILHGPAEETLDPPRED